MSMTKSVGVVGPSHWSYMAAIMAQQLLNIIKKSKIEERDIPAGVYVDAKEFFHLVDQALGGNLPENPPASMSAYVIAADVAKASTQIHPGTSQELEKRLARYNSFVKDLGQPRTLTQQDTETAKELQRFFVELCREGESESYERHVRSETSSEEMRFVLSTPAWRYC